MRNRRPSWPLWFIIVVLLIYGISQQGSQHESPPSPDRAIPEPAPSAPQPPISATDAMPSAPVASVAAPSHSPGDRFEPPAASIDTSGNARVGGHVAVSIDVDSKGIAMRTVLVRLQYDRSKLRLAWASAGEVMSQASITSSFAYEDAGAGGEVVATLTADNDGAVAGAGSVAVFDFEAVDEGTAGVTLLLLEIQDTEGKVVQSAIAGPQYITIER